MAETAVSASVFSRVRNVPCCRNSLAVDFSPHDLADGRALIGGKDTVPLEEERSEALAYNEKKEKSISNFKGFVV